MLEPDGLVLSPTNVPEPSLNAAYVEREPSDPAGPLSWAEGEMAARAHSFGIDYPPGRWPALDAAIRGLGFELLLSRPMMVAEVAAIPDAPPPAGIRMEPVEGRADALALAQVDAAVFGTRLEIAERAFAPAVVGVDGARGFLARHDAEPVGCAVAQGGAGATAVFGVGVVPQARRRGIGAALTVAAARAFPADLAWLVSSEMAHPMCERLGFRDHETWEVWVRA